MEGVKKVRIEGMKNVNIFMRTDIHNLLIYRWCGRNNIAKQYSQLGPDYQLDR